MGNCSSFFYFVPSPRGFSSSLFLPFDGDRILAVLLSKAMLLMNDDKITDRSILLRMNRI